jgi:tetratricopeptide (TPR) repeat protein
MKKLSLLNISSITLLVLALAIRLLYLMQFSSSPIFNTPIGPDVEEYDLWARQIIAGDYLWNYVHIHSPLYPFLLAFEYRIFSFNHFLVRYFQLIIGIASTLPLVFSLRLIQGRWTVHNLILAILWITYPPLIYYGAEYISEALLVPLLCLSVYLAYCAEEKGKSVLFISAGITGGLAILAHPMAGLFVLAETLYLFIRWFRRKSFRIPFIYFAAAAAVVAPVTFYNYAILGRMAPVQANSGLNFYLGNNADADGTCYLRPGPEWNKVHALAEKTASAAFVSKDHYFLSESWNFINNHPLKWTILLAQKALYAWNYRELTSGADPAPLKYYTEFQALFKWAFGAVAILAISGLLLNWNNRSFLYNYRHFLILLFSFWIVQIIFVTSGRYRLGMLPGIIVLAAFTIDYLIRNFRTAFYTITPYVGIAAAIVILPVPHVAENREKAEAFTLLGEAYMKTGNLADAEFCLLKASSSMDTWSRSYNLLGMLSEKQNRMQDAEKYYLKALKCDDNDACGLMNLGVIYSSRNEYDRPLAYFKKALEVDDKLPDLHYNYALFLSKYQGNGILEERHYWECLKLDPSHRKALNNMGVLMMRKSNFKEAATYFARAHTLNPGNADIIVNLAAANLAQGKQAEGEKLLRKALAIDPKLPAAKRLEQMIAE